MSEERRFFSSVWSSERMPIVTLSKSMSSAALGAWWTWLLNDDAWETACGPRWIGAIACGPRCTGPTCRCALDGADGCGREIIFLGITCAWLRACVFLPRRLHAV